MRKFLVTIPLDYTKFSMLDIHSVLCINYLCSFYIFIIQYFKLEYKLLFLFLKKI